MKDYFTMSETELAAASDEELELFAAALEADGLLDVPSYMEEEILEAVLGIEQPEMPASAADQQTQSTIELYEPVSIIDRHHKRIKNQFRRYLFQVGLSMAACMAIIITILNTSLIQLPAEQDVAWCRISEESSWIPAKPDNSFLFPDIMQESSWGMVPTPQRWEENSDKNQSENPQKSITRLIRKLIYE